MRACVQSLRERHDKSPLPTVSLTFSEATSTLNHHFEAQHCDATRVRTTDSSFVLCSFATEDGRIMYSVVRIKYFVSFEQENQVPLARVDTFKNHSGRKQLPGVYRVSNKIYANEYFWVPLTALLRPITILVEDNAIVVMNAWPYVIASTRCWWRYHSQYDMCMHAASLPYRIMTN